MAARPTYLVGAAILTAGVIRLKNDVCTARGLDRLVLFGPMFLAIPMAVFGTEHFVFSQSVVPLVPSWTPERLFWVLLVGTCLIAGALSLVLRKHAQLAAAPFGVLLLVFELLIHMRKILQTPQDRFACTVSLRDFAFSAGALSFAATQPSVHWKTAANKLLTSARFSMGIASVFFAVEHFLYPEFKPGVPLKQLTPLWFPGRFLVAYLTGFVLLAAGLGLICNKRSKEVAVGMGLMQFVLALVFYLPITILRPSAIGSGLKYLANTLLFSGSVLCLAGSQQTQMASSPQENSPNALT